MIERELHSWHISGPGLFFCAQLIEYPDDLQHFKLPIRLTGYVRMEDGSHHYKTSYIAKVRRSNFFAIATTKSGKQYQLFYHARRTSEPRATLTKAQLRNNTTGATMDFKICREEGHFNGNFTITGKIDSCASDTPEDDIQITTKNGEKYYHIESPISYSKSEDGIIIVDIYNEYYLVKEVEQK